MIRFCAILLWSKFIEKKRFSKSLVPFKELMSLIFLYSRILLLNNEFQTRMLHTFSSDRKNHYARNNEFMAIANPTTHKEASSTVHPDQSNTSSNRDCKAATLDGAWAPERLQNIFFKEIEKQKMVQVIKSKKSCRFLKTFFDVRNVLVFLCFVIIKFFSIFQC